MKINYKNTALEFLENPKGVSLHTPDGYQKPQTKAEDYKLLYTLQSQFDQDGFSNFFNKNIQFVTTPFYEAYRKAANKLKDVVLKTQMNESGTLIFRHETHTQTMFYRINSIGDGTIDGLEAFIVMLTKHSKSDSFAVDLSIWLSKNKNELMDIVWKGFVEQGRDMSWWIAELMLFKTFLKYAEVESKVIPGNKKDYHVGVKYLNETKNKVEVLDSTYFTTISRTEGFGVRGHFRFQPCGPWLTERRLQWISEFQKHGYTRMAKILNQ